MKLSINLKWIIFLAFQIQVAQAQGDYTPVLDSASQVGRLMTYESLGGDTVYVPTAFDQTFRCLESNGVCSFQVYNRLSRDELIQFETISKNGSKIVPLRADLFASFVSIRDSHLSGRMTELQNNYFSASSLTILESPYAQAYFKSPAPAALNTEYVAFGLGSLHTQYQLTGVMRDFEIKIAKAEMDSFLQEISSHSFTFAELKSSVANKLRFTFRGYDQDDVPLIIAYALKEDLTRSAKGRTLVIDQVKKEQLLRKIELSKFWVIGQSFVNAQQTCEAELNLKANSVMTILCEDPNAVF